MPLIDNVVIQPNRVHDFFSSMIRLENNQAFIPQKGANSSISDWAERTMGTLPPDMRILLKTFFNLETSFGMSLMGYSSRWNENTADLLSHLEDVPAENMLRRFFYSGVGPGRDVEPEDVRRLIEDDKLAVQFINEHLSFPPQEKWQVLQFVLDPESMKQDLLRLFTWYYENVYKKIEGQIHPEVVVAEKELRDRLSKYGDEYLKLLLPIDYSRRREPEITLVVSYFLERSTSMNVLEDLYVMGYRYFERAESKHAIISGTQMFKALADETRLNILRLLIKRPWYGHEIAQKLGISNSTVSHHVTMLVMQGLLHTYREENRVYFELVPATLKEVLLNVVDGILSDEQ